MSLQLLDGFEKTWIISLGWITGCLVEKKENTFKALIAISCSYSK